MNLILFSREETLLPLPRSDPRAEHLLGVLRRRPGDEFDAGLINGPRGRGTVVTIGPRDITLAFAWGEMPPPPDPLTLIVGLARPQTARDILRDATTFGTSALHFVLCEKTERSYSRSTLWTKGEWRRHVLAGAAQSFDTRVPEVFCGATVTETVAQLSAPATRLALDNYEATVTFSKCRLDGISGAVLAFGPERGWSDGERKLLRTNGFILASLGQRVLRTETAVVAALALVKAGLGLL